MVYIISHYYDTLVMFVDLGRIYKKLIHNSLSFCRVSVLRTGMSFWSQSGTDFFYGPIGLRAVTLTHSP